MLKLIVFTFHAIGPIVGLIVLGYILRHCGLTNEVFLKTANRFVFRVCLPVLLFCNIYAIEDLQMVNWSAIAYSFLVTGLLFICGLLMVHRVKEKDQKGVILQCIFRSNYAIIGLPLAASLGDANAVAFASVLSAFSIPLFNILAVIALSIYIEGEKGSIDWRKVLYDIVHNPLICGIAAGVAVLAVRRMIPHTEDGELVVSLRQTLPVLYKILQDLSRIASPLALIVLGGLFEFSAVDALRRQIIAGTIARIILAPAIGLGLGILLSSVAGLQLTSTEYPALIALFSTPAAVSSAIMAGEMKNDEQLASQLVVWTSLVSILTISVIIILMKQYQFI